MPGDVPVYSRHPILIDGTCFLKAWDWMKSPRETVFIGLSTDPRTLQQGRGQEKEEVKK